MDYKTKEYNTDDNMERVKRLPDEYITAMEIIVDHLDKDWKNKLVHGKYVAYLCDMFEEALAQGKTVEQLLGNDIVAYAEKFQKEIDFRDLEPTFYNTLTNTFLAGNVLFLFGFNMMNPIILTMLAGIEQTGFSYTMIVVSIVLLVIGLVVKGKKLKVIDVPVWLVFIEMIVMEVCGVINDFGQLGILIGFLAVTVFDYAIVFKKIK